jgi:hypothetical protein
MLMSPLLFIYLLVLLATFSAVPAAAITAPRAFRGEKEPPSSKKAGPVTMTVGNPVKVPLPSKAKATPVKMTLPAKAAPVKMTLPAKVAPVKMTLPAKAAPVKMTLPAKAAPVKMTLPAKAAPVKMPAETPTTSPWTTATAGRLLMPPPLCHYALMLLAPFVLTLL